MLLKNKITRWGLYTVLLLCILYTGTTGIATLHQALTQPYLCAGAVRYDFMGYYLIAAISGAICLVLTVTGLLLLFKRRKNARTEK